MDRIGARPAVQKGLDIPEPNKMKEMKDNPEAAKKAIEDAQKMMVSTSKQ